MSKAKILTDVAVRKLSKSGVYGAGAGLYIRVTDTGSKHWIHRFNLDGKAHWMGLGPYPEITLAEAQGKTLEARRLRLSGVNPIVERDAEKARKRGAISFQDCADRYIAAHRGSWKNAKHIDQWINTVSDYAGPVIGSLPVNEIDVGQIMRVLDPIWSTKAETASRLRGRIESILDWATVRGYREGENPARWKGNLKHLLPSTRRIRRVTHHKALGYTQIGELMVSLRQVAGNGSKALEFAILTACRSGEVRFATWKEVNLKDNVWIIPAERMKAGKEHRIPLSDAAIAVLDQMDQATDLIFPGRADRPMSDMTISSVLKRMGREDATVHGFRSTFRDWAAECTAYPREVAEMALAHTIGDKVEAAYRRGDLFAKRTRMMQEWANFCNQTQGGEVIPLKRSNTVT